MKRKIQLIFLALTLMLFIPFVLADNLIVRDDFCEYNGSIWNITTGANPTYANCEMTFDTDAIDMWLNVTNHKFPVGANSMWYIKINFSTDSVASGKTLWSFNDGTGALGEGDGMRWSGGGSTGTAGWWIINCDNFLDMALDMDNIFVMQNITYNYTSANVSVHNTHTPQSARLNGSTLCATPAANPITDLHWGRAGDSGGPIVKVSLFELWEVTGAAAPDPIPTVVIDYPSDGAKLDNSTYVVYINGTVSMADGSNVNHTWINDTRFSLTSNVTSFNFTFNGSFIDQYTYHVMVLSNGSTGVVRNDTVTFTIDLTTPTLTSSLDLNHTLYYLYRNITFEINASDGLQVYSFNVTTPEGFLFNVTGLDTTKYIFNGSVNTSGYELGKRSISATTCDAHTSKEIIEWDSVKEKVTKKITFDFDTQYISIKPCDADMISEYSTNKEIDRYTLKYKKNPLNKDDNQCFIVESSDPIDILGNKKGYYGWLVVPKQNKWIDFNTKGMEGMDYSIKRLSSNSVEINIDGLTEDEFTFNSIGDLNCYTQQWHYYLYNYTATYSPTVVETTKDILKLVIDFKDIILNGNGSLMYEGIGYVTNNISSINQINLTINFTIPSVSQNISNVTFFWNFEMNDTVYQTINFTQIVQRIQLAICGDLTNVPTLNISIFNEQLPSSYIESDIDVTFNVWTNDSSNLLNFTFDFNSNTNYTICIFPNTSVNVNAYFFYNSSSGLTERWYLTNAKFTTNTSLLYLFGLTTTTDISEMRGTLRNSEYNYFPLVIAKLQRLYPSENVWRTVQMDRSDDFGQILFYIEEKEVDYKINFEYGGNEIDKTNPMKFICTASICTLTFIVTEDLTITTEDLSFKSAYNNFSEMFQLNWTDSSGLTSSIRLVVSKDTGAKSTTICDKTLVSSSGTLNCNTTGYDGTLFVRAYKTQSPLSQVLFKVIDKVKEALWEKIDSNEGMFWAVGISSSFITGGAIVGGPVGAIFSYVIALIFINMFKLVSFVTLTYITTVAVMGGLISWLVRK